ncbi:MAG: 16S rRNA (guanine966-N2)-methyltransferase [Planctomycetota bacterium]|jgi:16S rRNA (guanine966-N2)-methyltransferase
MRIIAGEHRGRKLAVPPGLSTRPMLDRVREALFSTLGPGIDGAYCLDLFAGSGSLGLEALSRGAAYARFVEMSPQVVSIIEANVNEMDLGDRAKVICASATNQNHWSAPEGEPDRWADVILFDPPYPWLRDDRRRELFEAVNFLAAKVLRPGGLLVFHTPRRGVKETDFPAHLDADQRVYGTSALWYIRGEEDSQEEVEEVEDKEEEGA